LALQSNGFPLSGYSPIQGIRSLPRWAKLDRRTGPIQSTEINFLALGVQADRTLCFVSPKIDATPFLVLNLLPVVDGTYVVFFHEILLRGVKFACLSEQLIKQPPS